MYRETTWEVNLEYMPKLSKGSVENLRKSSESGRKSTENRQKRLHQYVYMIKKDITRWLEDINFMFLPV